MGKIPSYNGKNPFVRCPVATKWLSVAQVADELGVTVDTVRNWINRKKDPLPAAKLGRDWKVKREDLDRFINERKNIRDDD
jgi:excisionase family DNA binding protein